MTTQPLTYRLFNKRTGWTSIRFARPAGAEQFKRTAFGGHDDIDLLPPGCTLLPHPATGLYYAARAGDNPTPLQRAQYTTRRILEQSLIDYPPARAQRQPGDEQIFGAE